MGSANDYQKRSFTPVGREVSGGYGLTVGQSILPETRTTPRIQL